MEGPPLLDLVIVGAGAAGIGAALAAREHGLSFRLVEAMARSGGRAWTDTTTLGQPFDLGCHWIQNASRNPFTRLARLHGFTFEETPLRFYFHDGRRLLGEAENDAGNAAFERFTGLVRAAAKEGADRPIAEVLPSGDPWRPYFERWLEHEAAGAVEEISVLDASATGGGDEEYPLGGGFGALIQRVAEGLPVTLDCPVEALDLSGRGVRAQTPRGTLEAKAAILTASTAVLASGAIALKPGGWPAATLAVLEALPLGSATKIAFRLPREAAPEIAPGTFVQCSLERPENIAWHLWPHGFDQAVGYLGGTFSRALALAGPAAQEAWGRARLVELLGGEAARHIGPCLATPYDREPFLGGGYAFCRAGLGCRRADLAEPIGGRIFPAGEAASADFPGTAHGAFLSGQAAVARFLEEVRSPRSEARP